MKPPDPSPRFTVRPLVPDLTPLGCVVLVFMGLLTLGRVARAGNCVDYADYIHAIGSLDTEGLAVDVALSPGYAWLADSHQGLVAVDLSDPSHPAFLASLAVCSGESAVAVSGDHAYIACGGLIVVDIHNPASTVMVGSVDLPVYSRELCVGSGYAYVADEENALHVVDVRDPAAPRWIATVPLPGPAYGAACAGPLIYVGAGESGLHVIDGRDPEHPVLLHSVPVQGMFAMGLAVAGSFVYVAEFSGLGIYDISGTLPVRLGWLPNSEVSVDVAVSGTTAFVVISENRQIDVVDVSVPSDPRRLTLVGSAHGPCAVAASGGLVYVADGSDGLTVIDASNPEPVPILASLDTPGGAQEVALQGDFAYVADGPSRTLRIVDVAAPLAPVARGAIELGGYTWTHGVVVEGGYAYVAHGTDGGLKIVDIRNPDAPFLVGSLDTSGDAYRVALAGRYALVADGGSGIQVIDVGVPSAPNRVGGLDTPGSARGVTISGTTLYVADGNAGLLVVDVSDPIHPAVLGSVDPPFSAISVTVEGDLAYVGGSAGGAVGEMGIIDVGDPSNPTVLGSIVTPDVVSNVAVLGGYALAAGQMRGVHVIDVTDMAHPILVGSCKTLHRALGIVASGDLVFVADDLEGIQVLPGHCPALAGAGGRPAEARAETLPTLRVHPNPVEGHATVLVAAPEAGRALVSLHDSSGRLVRRIFEGGLQREARSIAWDGLDAYRRPAPAGVYFVRLLWENRVTVRKVVVE